MKELMTESLLTTAIFQKRRNKRVLFVLTDVILIFSGYSLAFIFCYFLNTMEGYSFIILLKEYSVSLMICTIVHVVTQWLMKQYQNIWTLAGIEDFTLGVISFIGATVLNLICSVIIPHFIPSLVVLLAGVLSMLLCNGVRVEWRLIRRMLTTNQNFRNSNKQKVLIYGAGRAGSLVANEYRCNPRFGKKVIGFIDDDIEKIGTFMAGTPVIGTRGNVREVIETYQIDEVIVAIANLDQSDLKSISLETRRLNIDLKIMPGLFEVIDNKFNVGMIRDVQVEDLLARDSIKLDHEGISDYLENQVVMVTGGGGSIGSELCRQIVKFNPKQLIILDIYENNAYDLQNELMSQYPALNLVTLIASVRDRHRLADIYKTYQPNVVFHAAAHKHVPLMEVSPSEAIKNNVLGTLNTAELASEYKVKRFVLISTDKAVNPTNVMGATKRLCEMIIQSLNSVSETEYVAVRFGNVLGSNGSVVPLFKKQIAKGGPVTLTHKDITRYFMTIPEAAQLVLQAGGFAKGGEIFVLDMGQPVKIYDLACNLIQLSGYEPDIDIKIEVTGLRPGEKLYEELLMKEEGLRETRHQKIFIGQPGEFDLEIVKSQIQELLLIATTKEISDLKAKLKEVVPTYAEPKHHNVG